MTYKSAMIEEPESSEEEKLIETLVQLSSQKKKDCIYLNSNCDGSNSWYFYESQGAEFGQLICLCSYHYRIVRIVKIQVRKLTLSDV